MRWEWKKELKKVLEAPAPVRKEEFLEKYGQQEIRISEFLLVQAGYIRKWVWAVSASVFLVALVGAVALAKDMVWAIAALTPALALAAVAEGGRSASYGMEELEMATRFSLKSVLLARLGILGMENLLILCLLVPLGLRNNQMEPIRAGVCMVTPFLLTACIGLFLVRRIRGQEGTYFCMAGAVCVSLATRFLRDEFLGILWQKSLAWWGIGSCLLFAGIVWQCKKMVKCEM